MEALERMALLQLAALSGTLSCCCTGKTRQVELGQRVRERFKARSCAGVEYCSAYRSQMQSVAVLSAVCRRWRASLTLVEHVSVSYASQAVVDESLVKRDSQGNAVDCTSFGTKLPATNYAFRNEQTFNLLKAHWSNGERKRQVSL